MIKSFEQVLKENQEGKLKDINTTSFQKEYVCNRQTQDIGDSEFEILKQMDYFGNTHVSIVKKRS